ncbi:hypothetical protein GUJ93_ZPchr0001g30688 [Zizania palustris]|uniref:Uncharacterized protein n=1 Tax=Zizania palustris TaxID=103762 RepID=A0A8J5V090_ZIZPA|nr:hypothetical protein GUJ93_ZPchr0001g30688 [Zizania palustris]
MLHEKQILAEIPGTYFMIFAGCAAVVLNLSTGCTIVPVYSAAFHIRRPLQPRSHHPLRHVWALAVEVGPNPTASLDPAPGHRTRLVSSGSNCKKSIGTSLRRTRRRDPRTPLSRPRCYDAPPSESIGTLLLTRCREPKTSLGHPHRCDAPP